MVDRLDDEVISDAKLSCEVRENYVKFKLGRIRSNLCMFATRLALKGRRRKDKRRENDGFSRGTNGSVSENDCGNEDSEDVRDKAASSRVSEAGCSTRFVIASLFDYFSFFIFYFCFVGFCGILVVIVLRRLQWKMI